MTRLLDALLDRRWIGGRQGRSADAFRIAFEAGRLTPTAAPNALFDADWYRDQHGIDEGLPALTHYLDVGWRAALNPGPYFDVSRYRNLANLDDDVEPLGHFLNVGVVRGLVPVEPTIEMTRRLIEDPNAQLVLESLRRWCSERSMIDPEWYAWFHGLASPAHSESHYWSESVLDHDRPNLYFDPAWYLEQYQDARDAGLLPFVHFAEHGWARGHHPAPVLNTRRFQAHHGPALPFDTLRSRKVRAGVVAPAYPEHPPNASEESDRVRVRPSRALMPAARPFDPDRITMHWLIPDFGHGGGGHANIFTLASHLERRGHPQRIWVDGRALHDDESALRMDALRWYDFDGELGFLPEEASGLDRIDGDVVVATAWQTAQTASHLTRFRRRFYFVQDYEPLFYPAGTLSLLASRTYDDDFDFFCASPWLADKCREHGGWADSFFLVPNEQVYHPDRADRRDDSPPLIVAYARNHTTRRCVELLQSALTELACRGAPFEVLAFGMPPDLAGAWRNLGVRVRAVERATPQELAEAYRRGTIGVALSATNYSQVPPEMMACELPVVDVRLEATAATYAPGTVALAAPEPVALADTMHELLGDEHQRRSLAEAGRAWVQDNTWDRVADHMIAAVQDRVSATVGAPAPGLPAPSAPLVTVVVPTLNAEHHIPELMDSLQAQECDFDFEVLVVDSSSTDRTVELAEARGATVIVIDRSDFQHGRTRNFAVQNAAGSFVAFLTQDAVPDDRRWLSELVTPMLENPDVAGVFGRHRAHDDATAFTKVEIDEHFDGLRDHGSLVSRTTDLDRYQSGDPGWRQMLYFYSDNNSCLRKDVWRRYPYPAIPFGEDQAWAQTVIDAGHVKAYADRAVVRHSHDFDPAEARVRGWEEATFFASWFGLLQLADREELESVRRHRHRRIRRIGRDHGLDDDAVTAQLEAEDARLEGMLIGSSQRTLDPPDRDPR